MGLLAAAAALLWHGRHRSIEAAEASTSNVVGMLTQHTERTFDSIDMLLKVVARELGPRPDDTIRQSELSAKLGQLAQDLPHVTSVRLLDPKTGTPSFEFNRTAPAGHFSDAEALAAHKANRYLSVHIGTPFFDGGSRTWLVGVSRRVSGQEGVPGLVVLALLNLEYLHNFYASLDLGINGSISIIRSDGTMLARRPFNPGWIGYNVSQELASNTAGREQGNFRIIADTDGALRIYAFRRLARTPLVITAGLSESEILQEWYAETRRGMTIAGAAVIILLALGEALARVVGQRERAERELIHAARHDSLTGLSNRAELQRRLNAALNVERSALCILLLDLDGFKTINDTLGHDAGDAVLVAAAGRLSELVPPDGYVSRFGGDEFAIILPGAVESGCSLAARVIEALRRPFRHDGETVVSAASIGIAASPVHGLCATDLLKNADIALYSAKASGRSRFAVFEPVMRAEIDERVRLHAEVKSGIDQDLFVPFYQPQVSLVTGEIDGFEALARWCHPSRGLVGPVAFVSAFENHELAVALGRCMLRRVLDDVRNWNEQGTAVGRVAVNASAAELDHPDYASWVLNQLRARAINPTGLEIEVTEGVLFGRTADRVHANLRHLHSAGIRIALDDFGTGYASLTHLKQFPISALKIDRGFVHNLEADRVDASIVTAVTKLAKALNFDVVAEGVERPSQVDFLKKVGCTRGQGFLFAKPMSGSRVRHFIESHEARPPAEGGRVWA